MPVATLMDRKGQLICHHFPAVRSSWDPTATWAHRDFIALQTYQEMYVTRPDGGPHR